VGKEKIVPRQHTLRKIEDIFFIIHIIYKRKYKNKFFETGLTKCPIHHAA